MTESETLREILSAIYELRDEIVTKLLKRDTIDSVDASRIRRLVDARLKNPELGDRIGEVLSKFSRWSFADGVDKIDKVVSGADLAGALNLPPESIDIAEKYITGPSKIKTIPGPLLEQVHTQLSLGFLGQRTPGEIAERIERRFAVAAWRAETIVRTEGKRLHNIGAEQRIQTTASKAKTLGIPMVRTWIHSSGMKTKAGKYDKATGTRKGFKPGKVRARYIPRPHHKAMHGTEVAPDQKFHLVNPITGEEWYIEGPHDELLPASEVVNCYCDRSIRIDDEALMGRAVRRIVSPPPAPPTPAPPPAPPVALPRQSPRPQTPQPIAVPEAKNPAEMFTIQRGDAGAAPRKVLKLIDQIHGVPDMDPIPIRRGKTGSALGFFETIIRSDGTNRANRIVFSPSTPTPMNTVAHEIGHRFDLDALGKGTGKYASEFGKAGKIIDACMETEGFKKLMEMKTDRPRSVQFEVGDRSIEWTVDHRFVEYLTRKREIFARAYAQYIAIESGDATMLAEMRQVHARSKLTPYQMSWSEEEFEPIRDAFNAYFEEQGWKRKKSK